MEPPEIDFRFTPKSGHSEAHAGLPRLTQRRPTGDEVCGRQASGTYGRYCRHCGTACLATALP